MKNKYRITAIGGTRKIEGETTPFYPGVVRRVSLESAQKAAAMPECFKVLELLPRELEEGEMLKEAQPPKGVEEVGAEDSGAESNTSGPDEAGEEDKPDEPGAIPSEWDEKLKEFNSLTVGKTDDWLDNVSHVPFLEYLAANAKYKGSKDNAEIRIKEIQEKAQD